MRDKLRIALLIESSRGYGRQLLQGIAAYSRLNGPWSFFHEERNLGAPLPKNLKSWRPQGIIARLSGETLIRQIRAMGLPTVDLYHEDETVDIPGVIPDQEALVRVAVDHFLDLGFRHFAYCGFPGILFSDLRAASFQQIVASRGFPADVYCCRQLSAGTNLASVEAHVMRRSGELAIWLRGLPKPAALLACNDMRGQQVVTVCNEIGVVVPDEVAVLGIDNDDVQCELCDPALSSVNPNIARIGYEAAALMDRMIAGEAPPRTRILVHPCGVIVRRSTDTLAIPDRDAAEAIRFAREHACDPGIEIEDIFASQSTSRATFNRWFRKWLGRSPREEINRIRLNRIKDLLASTALPLEEIAHRCGIQHVESMCRMVKRTTGRTPREFRMPAD